MNELDIKKDLQIAELYKNIPCSICGLKSIIRVRETPLDQKGGIHYGKTHVLAACDVHVKDLCNLIKQKPLFPINKTNSKIIKSKNNRNPISAPLRHECFKKNQYRCVECGAKANQTRLHVDHIIPISQGGLDELSNLQTLCSDCNHAKHNRFWIGGLIDD